MTSLALGRGLRWTLTILDTKYGSCITDRVRVCDHCLPVDNPLDIIDGLLYYISLRIAMTLFTLGHLIEWSLSSLGTKFGALPSTVSA